MDNEARRGLGYAGAEGNVREILKLGASPSPCHAVIVTMLGMRCKCLLDEAILMDTEALRASGPEAYRAYVAVPVALAGHPGAPRLYSRVAGNEGRRKKRPALCGEAMLRKGRRYGPFAA